MKTEDREVLLIHMGGLGDVCLSESLFLSLSRYFRDCLVACGIKRFFNIFSDYFIRIENIESAKWLFLFSQKTSDITWERIIFIGKDIQGSLRSRLKRYSRAPLIFIDMYPQEEQTEFSFHVEDYQLNQLFKYDIEPVRKEIIHKKSDRVILYPERGFRKQKWQYENFIELYRILNKRRVACVFLEPFDHQKTIEDSLVIRELKDMRDFFSDGGVFVSNDSGMAHLAGACGLSTVTIFTDFNPAVWHPRGRNISLKSMAEGFGMDSVLEAIDKML